MVRKRRRKKLPVPELQPLVRPLQHRGIEHGLLEVAELTRACTRTMHRTDTDHSVP